MYICDNCGALITSLIPIHEYHNELDENKIEIYYGCSRCRSPNVTEAKQCDLCGEYVAHDYIILKDGTVVCSQCYTMY